MSCIVRRRGAASVPREARGLGGRADGSGKEAFSLKCPSLPCSPPLPSLAPSSDLLPVAVLRRDRKSVQFSGQLFFLSLTNTELTQMFPITVTFEERNLIRNYSIRW